MKTHPIADLYADYLLASCGATTATGLSQRLEGAVSHEQVSRDLAGTQKTASALGRTGKPFGRAVPAAAGGLSMEDSSEETPYTDENDSVWWQDEHATERGRTGSNCLPAR